MKNKVSLIIAVYKRVDFLELIFKSLENQTFRDFQVIIAEDDCSPVVKRFVKEKEKNFPFEIKHISQEDNGFRKNILLNKAIRIADGEYLIFIDGDCILVKDHVKNAKPNVCLFGRRVMLDAKTSEMLIKAKCFKHLSFMKLLFTKTGHLESAIRFPFFISRRKTGVLGCNFSVFKDKMIKINGFDEDFTCPFFGEDTDIERRLTLIGVKLQCSKFQTIQYHLHHPTKDRDEDWKISGELYERKVKEGKSVCDNGYIKR
ncbi:MAG: glycosyltransferase [Marinomonas foliarum]|uniref:glycosyltransferase n=1 Tax=Marinomonas foliarum TaxID=491950 RepID=UPI003F9A23D5